MARARRITALPPVEYDKPYEKADWSLPDRKVRMGVRELCSGAVFRGHAFGCRRRLEEGECEIVLLRQNYQSGRRHPRGRVPPEQGHCNGWGSDHEGARAIVIPAPSAKVSNGACARGAAGTIGCARPVLFR
jgi:hypothetical protein